MASPDAWNSDGYGSQWFWVSFTFFELCAVELVTDCSFLLVFSRPSAFSIMDPAIQNCIDRSDWACHCIYSVSAIIIKIHVDINAHMRNERNVYDSLVSPGTTKKSEHILNNQYCDESGES